MTDLPAVDVARGELAPASARNPLADRAERALSGLRFRPFLTVLGIVVILAGLYYAFIATPLYISETQFAIRGRSGGSSSGSLGAGGGGNIMASLTGGGGGPIASVAEMTAVSEYIRSQDMLGPLQAKHDLLSRYAAERADPFRRLSPDASKEDFLKFYRKMVTVQLEREAGLIKVHVRDFNAQDAYEVAQTISQLSEAFVDGLSTRLRSESLRFADQDLRLAQAEVQRARSAVANFRTVGDNVNPQQSGTATVGGVSSLEAQAASIRAELNALRTYSQPNAPLVRQAEARLATVNAQIEALRARQGGGGLSRQVSQYEALLAQRTFAETRLATVQTAYDQARAAARDQEKYVVTIVRANRPDKAVEPRRVADFLMVVLFAAAAYAIVTLSIAGIRDHQGV